MNDINYCSVESIPGGRGAALFSSSVPVFREDQDILPVSLSDDISYMPWGVDNMMPFDLLDAFERDETLSTCQVFNAEVCYGAGLSFDYSRSAVKGIASKVDAFLSVNDLSSTYFGFCQDFKMFGFSVAVLELDRTGKEIRHVSRREACYCRFQEADKFGRIPAVIYGSWRSSGLRIEDLEIIPLLSPRSPADDLRSRLEAGDTCRKFAMVARIPQIDNPYYPIPYYASLFRGKWYNIKQYIGIAKESKLKNSAPIKYHIQVSDSYWDKLIAKEHITDRAAAMARIAEEKNAIIDFLTAAENSGKVLFSGFYVSPDGKEQRDIKIEKVDDSKEGGDWSTDIQEAINMICFTMRIHSNLVGSVPGKAQSNNSGSDKRELYTIAQAAQKPYRDMILAPYRLVCNFNGWRSVKVCCPFIQLTTLDRHTDAETKTSF